MELNKFLDNFAGILEDTDRSAIKPETRYKELGEWSSLMALAVIAMADEEYDVRIKGDDIRNTTTVEDLFKVVEGKIAAGRE